MELDLVVEAGERVYGVEVKSGATLAQDFFDHLTAFPSVVHKHLRHLQPVPRLVYGGDRAEIRGGVEVIPWAEIQTVGW